MPECHQKSCGVNPTVFQSLFLLFLTFDILLGRLFYLTRDCDFVIYKLFLTFYSE